MFALPGILFLVVLVLVRPFELEPSLQSIPLLYIAMGLALLGMAIDFGMGKNRYKSTPLTPLIILFYLWCFLTAARWDAGAAFGNTKPLLICILISLVMIHGAARPQSLHRIAGTLLLCGVYLAFIGVHQGLSPKQCLVIDETENMEHAVPDGGRSCDQVVDCYSTVEYRWDKRYFCEKVGLFGTTSITDGRVRYVGKLHDPNELGLTVGCALPIAYALRQEKRSVPSAIWALLATILIVLCVIFTGSRGAQLVVLAVFGCYFLVRSGVKGLVVAGIMAVPALAFGGRGGGMASASTTARLECWMSGAQMTLSSPILGVGYGNFLEHHVQTAHSAYLLASGENGFVGLSLFLGIVYVAIKIPLVALRRYREADDPRRAWAVAVLAAMAGLSVGILFLSFTYHEVFWLFVGVAGAYYSVLVRVDPGYELKLGFKDVLGVMVGSVVLVVLTYLYASRKLG
ncbi:MAG: hypothetical protein R3B72_12540 [Polyangiaceae bacterium]